MLVLILPISAPHSCIFIHSYFASTPYRPLRDAIPSRTTLLILLAAFVITAVSEVSLPPQDPIR